MKTSNAALLAMATAGLLYTAISVAETTSPMQTIQSDPSQTPQAAVRCYGLNSCKGTSACRTSANSCRGQNSCKGTGVLMVPSQQECITRGGSLTEIPSTPPMTPATQATLPPAAPYSGQ